MRQIKNYGHVAEKFDLLIELLDAVENSWDDYDFAEPTIQMYANDALENIESAKTLFKEIKHFLNRKEQLSK